MLALKQVVLITACLGVPAIYIQLSEFVECFILRTRLVTKRLNLRYISCLSQLTMHRPQHDIRYQVLMFFSDCSIPFSSVGAVAINVLKLKPLMFNTCFNLIRLCAFKSVGSPQNTSSHLRKSTAKFVLYI